MSSVSGAAGDWQQSINTWPLQTSDGLHRNDFGYQNAARWHASLMREALNAPASVVTGSFFEA